MGLHIVYMASIAGIDAQLYEACAIDGGGQAIMDEFNAAQKDKSKPNY